MEHEFAVNNQAVERYFLGEMPPGEQNEFEEHYFSCALCAEDVRATAAFLERAKPLLKEAGRERPQGARSGGWLGWLHPSMAYAAGLLACAGLIGYQNFAVIPALGSAARDGSGGSTRWGDAIGRAKIAGGRTAGFRVAVGSRRRGFRGVAPWVVGDRKRGRGRARSAPAPGRLLSGQAESRSLCRGRAGARGRAAGARIDGE